MARIIVNNISIFWQSSMMFHVKLLYTGWVYWRLSSVRLKRLAVACAHSSNLKKETAPRENNTRYISQSERSTSAVFSSVRVCVRASVCVQATGRLWCFFAIGHSCLRPLAAVASYPRRLCVFVLQQANELTKDLLHCLHVVGAAAL